MNVHTPLGVWPLKPGKEEIHSNVISKTFDLRGFYWGCPTRPVSTQGLYRVKLSSKVALSSLT